MGDAMSSKACPGHAGSSTHQPGTCAVGWANAFDPFEPAYMEDPAEYLRWAREQSPIFDTHPGGQGARGLKTLTSQISNPPFIDQPPIVIA